ncbi:cytochrome P450 [Aspergillus transmontanensis]|uniref:Cytochrome P450 n=1 Tax=Aspergillus transmontanensis TaxID=1034304 RepID=A0A5N6WFZ5_9EURO|nr:cytochrome P450 [Aspergillus transmontanensis]
MMGLPWATVYIAIAGYAIAKSTFGNFILLSILVSLLKVFYNWVLYPDFFTPIKKIPSPPGRSWITGNSDTVFLEAPYEHMRKWLENVPNDGLIRYYVSINLERILPVGPRALKEILVTKSYDFPKPEFIRASLKRLAGEHGLLLVEGDDHKKSKKNLLPAFAYRHIKEMYPIFWSKSIEMVRVMDEDLRKKADPTDNVLRMGAYASRAALDIVGVAGMDHDFQSLRDPNNKLVRTYQNLMSEPPLYMKIIFLLTLLLGDPAFVHDLPLERNRSIERSSETIRDVARQMIRQKRAKWESGSSTTEDIDIVSVALRSGNFTEEELVDQMMTFLGAGHETTSTALQWCVYVLCKHPDVQTRLREEIRTNLPPISTENPQPPAATDIDNLPYLNAVCNEVLRYHPSVPATIRCASRDTTIIGEPIPKGTLFLIAPEIIGKSKELWGPDADKFDPERWLGPGRANNGGADSNYANLTFLHGPRSCIGQGFAKAELACMVAVVVGKYHMELKNPNAPLEVRQQATVCPKDGVLAKFTNIEGW